MPGQRAVKALLGSVSSATLHKLGGAQTIALVPPIAGAFACLAIAGCAGGGPARVPSGGVAGYSRARPPSTVRTAHGSAAPFRFFSPTSFWNEPPASDAPVAPNSASMIGALTAQVDHELLVGNGPWINTTSSGVPVYTVPPGQPGVQVELTHHGPDAALSSAWHAVPLPGDAQPAAGSDADLVVWQPSSERLWEFWQLARTAGRWSASWGGAMQNVQSQQGVYGPAVWPEAKAWWGVTATSLSLVGGLISLEDLKHGEINHALSIAIPNPRAETYAPPAHRDDGSSPAPASLPEGAHLRLKPSLDLAALHLPGLTLMLARAAQRYGIFVTDRAPNIAFYAQDPTPTGSNPYTGANGFFEGQSPRTLLSSFPWSQLEVLAFELHHGR